MCNVPDPFLTHSIPSVSTLYTSRLSPAVTPLATYRFFFFFCSLPISIPSPPDPCLLTLPIFFLPPRALLFCYQRSHPVNRRIAPFRRVLHPRSLGHLLQRQLTESKQSPAYLQSLGKSSRPLRSLILHVEDDGRYVSLFVCTFVCWFALLCICVPTLMN